jgi:hypothetical protein
VSEFPVQPSRELLVGVRRASRQKLPFAALGITSAATIGIVAAADYLSDVDGTYYVDFAAQADGSALQVPVAFGSAPDPAKPPASIAGVAPGVSTPPPTRDAPALQRRACRVANVRGMRGPKAKRRLIAAGCSVRTVRARSRKVAPGRSLRPRPAQVASPAAASR